MRAVFAVFAKGSDLVKNVHLKKAYKGGFKSVYNDLCCYYSNEKEMLDFKGGFVACLAFLGKLDEVDVSLRLSGSCCEHL